MQAVEAGNEQVIRDVKRIAGAYEKEGWMPKSAQDLCHNTFHTLYMGMATQSSKETRSRAKELSSSIGSYHTDLDIDDIFNAQRNTFTKATGFEPKFKVYGGTQAENLALQVRMFWTRSFLYRSRRETSFGSELTFSTLETCLMTKVAGYLKEAMLTPKLESSS